MTPIDPDDLTPGEEEDLFRKLLERQQAQVRRNRAEHEIDQALRKHLEACGISEGDEWQEPTGTVSTYPKGWVAYCDGHQYLSDVTGATGEPCKTPEQWSLVYGDEGHDHGGDEDEVGAEEGERARNSYDRSLSRRSS